MGDASVKSKVDFSAYCRAFEVVEDHADAFEGNAGICERLDPGDKYYTADQMSRDQGGDGTVSIPNLAISRGRLTNLGSILLREDGTIVVKKGNDEEEIASVDSALAALFIAGAFGLDELSSAVSIDTGIVAGIRALYALCIDDSMTCKDSPEASSIAARLSAVAKGRSEVEKMKRELQESASEEKARSAAKAKEKSEADVRNKIRKYETEVARLIPMIEEEAPWYAEGRYEKALQAGLACMPRTSTLDAEFNVAKNKLSMVNGLVDRARVHGETSYCTGELTERTVTKLDGHGKGASVREETHRVCEGGSRVELGYDYSEEGLKAFAVSNCTTKTVSGWGDL